MAKLQDFELLCNRFNVVELSIAEVTYKGGSYKSIARASFGGEVKPSAPCGRFTACRRTLQNMSKMLWETNFLNPVSHL
jgi:hypothetical protein